MLWGKGLSCVILPSASFQRKQRTSENSSVGRAQPCQGWGREFESRFSLNEKPSTTGGFFYWWQGFHHARKNHHRPRHHLTAFPKVRTKHGRQFCFVKLAKNLQRFDEVSPRHSSNLFPLDSLRAVTYVLSKVDVCLRSDLRFSSHLLDHSNIIWACCPKKKHAGRKIHAISKFFIVHSRDSTESVKTAIKSAVAHGDSVSRRWIRVRVSRGDVFNQYYQI